MIGSSRLSGLGLTVVALLCTLALGLCVMTWPGGGLQAGVTGLLLFVLFSRLVLTGDHQLGLWYLAQHEYELAIPRFEASLETFTRRRWLDVLRHPLLLSPAAYRYREMALLGLGHCHAQLGDPQARDWYERCLADYPRNTLAKAALVLLHSGSVLAARAADDAGAPVVTTSPS